MYKISVKKRSELSIKKTGKKGINSKLPSGERIEMGIPLGSKKMLEVIRASAWV